jgi:translation initiation factor 3 subunit B
VHLSHIHLYTFLSLVGSLSIRFIPPANVRHVVFSPQENYLLTNNERPDDPSAIKIFHIPTGTLVRAFPLYPEDLAQEAKQQHQPPPPFLWSHDDKYLARMGSGMIRIYETPTLGLLEKRSLLADGIKEFQWCPTQNIIAYWAPEENNGPAHVDLIEIPSRQKLRQKNLYNVRHHFPFTNHGMTHSFNWFCVFYHHTNRSLAA